ncbi:hypothetical protein EZI54_06890 [Marinobacter halodurans]|uniref:Transcriptional regulator n=1 Tax=Marinobacter halodurans TaxID=2528979 RepID=A0ABY1ZM93_9GAMM|nr:hypothetical protein [Marinobacter halodurans]TBW57377.1 hypothetical protein EZI54_06890 [Marinobacter halodurans]
MQPSQRLEEWLRTSRRSGQPTLYRTGDFRSLFPGTGAGTYRAIVHRAERRGLLERICQGIYQYTGAPDTSGYVLHHAAAMLRPQHFNYISLETALSDAGVISQIPIGWITLVSTGRSATVDCGQYGTIEFVHTERSLDQIADQLSYDSDCWLFRANTQLAMDDMRRFGRDSTMDLVQSED